MNNVSKGFVQNYLNNLDPPILGGGSNWTFESGSQAIEGDSVGTCVLKKWSQASGPTLVQITLNFSTVDTNDESEFQVTSLAIAGGLVSEPTTLSFTLITNANDQAAYRVGSLTITPFGDMDGVLLNPNFGESSEASSVTLSLIL